MRKDKFLQQKLNDYAESCRPSSDSLLQPAREEFLRQKNQKIDLSTKQAASKDINTLKNTRQNARRQAPLYKFTGMAAAAVVFVFALIYMINIIPIGKQQSPGDKDTAPEISPYFISELTAEQTLLQDLRDAKGGHLLIADIAQHNAEAAALNLFHKDSEQPVAAFQKYKMLTDNGMDEIILIADLGGGLLDYKDIQQASNSYTYGGIVMYGTFDMYVQGEFYTALHFSYGDTDYYLIIMSPSRYSYRYFISLLSKDGQML